MGSFGRGGRLAAGRLDDEVDDFLGDAIGDAEVEAGNHHEAEHDGGGLRDLTAVRPLYALQLRPRGAQERGEAGEQPAARRRGLRLVPTATARGDGAGAAGALLGSERIGVLVLVDELVRVD